MAEVLVLGGPQVGKSALLKCLGSSSSCAAYDADAGIYSEALTSPTIGVDLVSVPLSRRFSAGGHAAVVSLREVGSSMKARWQSYLPASDAILFVIDASDTANMATSLVFLYEVLLARASSVKSKPLAVCVNKSDLCDEEALEALGNVFRFDDIVHSEDAGAITVLGGQCQNRINCLDTSAASAVIAWLSAQPF